MYQVISILPPVFDNEYPDAVIHSFYDRDYDKALEQYAESMTEAKQYKDMAVLFKHKIGEPEEDRKVHTLEVTPLNQLENDDLDLF